MRPSTGALQVHKALVSRLWPDSFVERRPVRVPRLCPPQRRRFRHWSLSSSFQTFLYWTDLYFNDRIFGQFYVVPCVLLGERIVCLFFFHMVFKNSRVDCWSLENVLESRQTTVRFLKGSLDKKIVDRVLWILLLFHPSQQVYCLPWRSHTRSARRPSKGSYIAKQEGLTPDSENHRWRYCARWGVRWGKPLNIKCGSGDAETGELIVENSNGHTLWLAFKMCQSWLI